MGVWVKGFGFEFRVKGVYSEAVGLGLNSILFRRYEGAMGI